MNVTFAAYLLTFQNRIVVCEEKKARTIMTVIVEVTKKKKISE